MKILNTILFIFLLGLLTCSGQTKQEETLFEGEIIYKTEYIPWHKNITEEYLNTVRGVQMKFSFKEGYSKKEFIDKEGNVLQTRIYDPKKNISYMFFPNNDTIWHYSPTKNEYEKVYSKDTDTVVILNYPSYSIEMQVTDESDQDSHPLIYKYYFANTAKIDPEWFKDGESGLYDLMKRTRTLSIKYFVDDGFSYRQTFTATKIDQKNIDKKTFLIPKNRPLIQL